jgi:NAD-dependent SIR2 family protein deacetylase
MSKTVVFLGAGASRPFGLPLTREIFPKVLRRLKSKALFGRNRVDQARLKRCLQAILPGLGETAGDAKESDELLPPITDVLSTLDYFLVTSNAPRRGLTLSELSRARLLLERALFELLVRKDDSIRMKDVPKGVEGEWRETTRRPFLWRREERYEEELRRTVDWLTRLAGKPADARVTLISTNYDIEIEQELYRRLGYDEVFRLVDFGIRVRDPATGIVHPRPENPKYGVFKLHGSFNWLRCDVCENVYVNPLGAIAYLSFLLGDAGRRKRSRWLKALEDSGANQCHCGHRPLRHVIVAPSFVRDVRDPILLEVWRSALEALREADRWIIVGYSLPPEDVAIRSLFLRAHHAREEDSGTSAPKVVVVQKQERKEPEHTRYRLLFRRYTSVGGGLSGYLKRRA